MLQGEVGEHSVDGIAVHTVLGDPVKEVFGMGKTGAGTHQRSTGNIGSGGGFGSLGTDSAGLQGQDQGQSKEQNSIQSAFQGYHLT